VVASKKGYTSEFLKDEIEFSLRVQQLQEVESNIN
jgi:hypothetical protein